jgi:small subunit ribosomal protein S3
MGQKVNPIGLRLGINKDWDSHWYASPREYASQVLEDRKIRLMIDDMQECKGADIAKVEIIRHPQRITVVIHTARPGVIIGIKGSNIEQVGVLIQKQLSKKVQIKIKEIKRGDANAVLVAQNVARQLVNRGSFRKALKLASAGAMKAGAQGVKIRVSGRLGGAEMSRTEEHKEGRVPLHTLRADIDYGLAEAFTTFGKIGVKVWIYNGMMYGTEQNDDAGQLLRRHRDDGRDDRRDRDDRPARSDRGDRAPRGGARTDEAPRRPRAAKEESTKAADAVKADAAPVVTEAAVAETAAE